MVLVKDVLAVLDKLSPFEKALEWDNVGLLVGDLESEVKGCVVSLDCTVDTIEFAKKTGANLIITHHPVIFEPLKSILAGEIAYELISLKINVISAHTNLDLTADGVNKALADQIGLFNQTIFKNADMVGICGTLETPLTPSEFAFLLKERILGNASEVNYVDCKKNIYSVAVVGGSGDDYLFEGKSYDAYITGEVSHHIYCYARNAGIQLFTIGHYHSEAVVLKKINEFLLEQFGDFKLSIYDEAPYKTI